MALRSRSAASAVLCCLLAAAAQPGTAQQPWSERLGFYQWVGTPVQGNPDDILTQARRYTTATGARVFRLYLGARYDYRHHTGYRPVPGSTPAQLLALPHYQAVLDDPDLHTIILTTYTSADYGAGPDDLNLLRLWTAAAEQTEREQIQALCEFLYARWGSQAKTVIIANSEADEKMLEIMNYTGSPQQAIATMTAWTRTRHDAITAARAAHPKAPLRVLHGFEISLVNLALIRKGPVFEKTPSGTWNALRDVVPHVRFDLLLYSSYESINSPYETGNTNVEASETGVRLRRDLDRIRERSRASLSAEGRRLFADRFVSAGELGFARDRFEYLPTGGVLPRLLSAVQAAADWGCPYIVLWQVFDAPKAGGEQFGFGLVDRLGRFPRLKPALSGCDSIQACLLTLEFTALRSRPIALH
jgi:hypothetical protein